MKRVFEELEGIKAELTERQAQVEQAEAELKLKQLKWEESKEKAFADVPEKALWRYKVIDKEYCFTTPHMLRFPESIFAIRASGRWKTEDVVYLDRNFVVFKLVALALCTGVIDERIPQDELDFYGLPSKVDGGERIQVIQSTSELIIEPLDNGSMILKTTKVGFQYASGQAFEDPNTQYTWSIELDSDTPVKFNAGIIKNDVPVQGYLHSYSVVKHTEPVFKVRPGIEGLQSTQIQTPRGKCVLTLTFTTYPTPILTACVNGILLMSVCVSPKDKWCPYFAVSDGEISVSAMKKKIV